MHAAQLFSNRFPLACPYLSPPPCAPVVFPFHVVCVSSRAFCGYPTGQWYCFDDTEVSEVNEATVGEQEAYILFYQRRTDLTRKKWLLDTIKAAQLDVKTIAKK
jgi:hypothetical protein